MFSCLSESGFESPTVAFLNAHWKDFASTPRMPGKSVITRKWIFGGRLMLALLLSGVAHPTGCRRMSGVIKSRRSTSWFG